MILDRLINQSSLLFRLLLGVTAVLLAVGTTAVVLSTIKESRAYHSNLTQEVDRSLDALTQELAIEAVNGDPSSVERILHVWAQRENIEAVSWQAKNNLPLVVFNEKPTAKRPDWFAGMVDLSHHATSREVAVGDKTYGKVTMSFTSIPMENRLWESVRANILMIVTTLVLMFLLLAFILHRGLAPLTRLASTARRIGAGDFSGRVAEVPGDAPEMRLTLTAFNSMANNMETLLGNLSEQRRAIDNAAPVTETDLKDTIIYANKKFCELTGYREEELLGQTHKIIKSREHPPEFFAGLWNTIRSGEVWNGEIAIRTKSGEIRWLATAITPVLGNDGKPQKYVAIRFDVTERRLVEHELRKSRDQLEERVRERTAELTASNAAQAELIEKLEQAHVQLLQSEKMASIGQLAAGVAHEINNPVGFVNSNLGTLQHYIADLLQLISVYEQRESEMTDEGRAAMAELKRQMDIDYLRGDVNNLLAESREGLQRVKRIVQDLKDFSHVEKVEIQNADLEQGLDSTINIVWNELKYKAKVIKEYGGIPKIDCIPSQLNQVFMNLLMNAVQAIESHGEITIRTGQEGDDVWVEVEDTGKGIKPEIMNRIFDPFFTTKPVGSGTGLGLSLSYSIVQKHHGRIEVKSEVGKGSVFRVVLPMHSGPGQ